MEKQRVRSYSKDSVSYPSESSSSLSGYHTGNRSRENNNTTEDCSSISSSEIISRQNAPGVVKPRRRSHRPRGCRGGRKNRKNKQLQQQMANLCVPKEIVGSVNPLSTRNTSRLTGSSTFHPKVIRPGGRVHPEPSQDENYGRFFHHQPPPQQQQVRPRSFFRPANDILPPPPPEADRESPTLDGPNPYALSLSATEDSDHGIPTYTLSCDSSLYPCSSTSSYKSDRIEKQRQMMNDGGSSLFAISPRTFLCGGNTNVFAK